LKICGDCRRGLRDHRRLDLEEALLVEVLPDRHRRAVPQHDVLLHARAAEVQVPVLQTDVLRHRRIVGDGKRRRLRVVEETDLRRGDLDLTGRNLRVDRVGGPRLDPAEHRHHELRAQALRLRHERIVVADDDLRDAVAIAQVEEQQRAEIADAVDPSEQHDVAPDVGGRQRAAGVRARKGP
jgi:hypothetical protein